jgi:hypothetical protein
MVPKMEPVIGLYKATINLLPSMQGKVKKYKKMYQKINNKYKEFNRKFQLHLSLT